MIFGKTHIGLVRETNEDALFYDEENKVMIIADGIGGHARGEEASNKAIESLRDYIYNNRSRYADKEKLLIDGFKAANTAVHHIQEGLAEGEGYAYLRKNDLGYLTGEAGRCGVRESQVFEFREEKLRELDPEGYQRFEKIYNQREKEPVQEMPDELKTGIFRWDYEDTEIALYVASYHYGNGLYVEMFSRCEDGVDGWEPFDDLTVNLPGYYLEPDEAYICADFSEDKLNFITDYGLGEILPEKGHSGMEEYRLVKFHLEKLAEFDRVGVEKYCASRGIDLARKQESLSRSEMQNKHQR